MFSSRFLSARDAVLAMQNTPLNGDIDHFFDRIAAYDPTIACLFWDRQFGSSDRLTTNIVSRSELAKRDAYSNRVYGVVPVYVSSVCAEQCVYCNYRADNRNTELERVRLPEDELAAEAQFLIERKGLRALELVYSSDPVFRADAMCRHVELVKIMLDKAGGGCVGINAEPLEEADYRRLVNAGLSFSVLWQETYDRQRYAELHPGQGRKTQFEYRLNAPERMIAGGIHVVGMGVLSGLSDWRFDWAMLMQHEAYLRPIRGADVSILGTPRLKPAAGALLKTTPMIPTTEEFLCAVAVHNIFSPNTHAFVNTREDLPMCIELARGGGCLFTFNCSTIPGGYSLGRQGYQFPTGSYDAPEFTKVLQARGLVPVLDWSISDSGAIAENSKGCRC